MPDSPRTVANVELIALFLQALFFGIFAVFFPIAIWILVYRNRLRRVESHSYRSNTHLIIAAIMFAFATAHFALSVFRALKGFVIHGGSPGGSAEYFQRVNDPTYVAKRLIYILQTLVGDSFMIYRLHIVWARNWWVVVVPILLTLASAVSGIGAIYEVSVATLDTVFAKTIAAWITTFFACSLATNVISTLLIVARIVWSNLGLYHPGRAVTAVWSVLETFIESAALYSVTLTVLLVLFATDSYAQNVVVDTMAPLIGIVFTMIIIRVGLNDTLNPSTASRLGPDVLPTHSVAQTHHRGALSDPFANTRRPVAITVSVTRDQDGGSFEDYSDNSKGVSFRPLADQGVELARMDRP